MRMYRAPRNAALIGAFTLRFHLNARRGRGIRGDLKREDPTLLVPYRSRLLLADRTKRAIQGRRDARRPRGATSRRVGLSGFLASLSPRSDERSHELLPRGPAPSSTSTYATISGSATLPPFSSPAALFSSLARSHERLVSTDVRSHTRATERSHAHEEGTSRPRVPTCAKRARQNHERELKNVSGS